MAKERNAKKEAKKKPVLSSKEKKLVKKVKKESRGD